VNGIDNEVRFHDPYLPPYLEQLRIEDLRVRDSHLTLLITRYEQDVGVRIAHREGTAKVAVLK